MNAPFKLRAPVASEDAEHLALARALRILVGPPGVLTKHGVMWFSIEHGKNASAAEGARRKRCGVVPGVPDLYVRSWDKSYWIELKRTNGGVVSNAQMGIHANLRACGDRVAVCKGWEDALRQLRVWEIPMRSWESRA